MAIKNNGYNRLTIVPDTALTSGTAAKIGTAENYYNIRKIIDKCGTLALNGTIDNTAITANCETQLAESQIDLYWNTMVSSAAVTNTASIMVSGADMYITPSLYSANVAKKK